MSRGRPLRARYVGYTRGTENHGDEALIWIIGHLLGPQIELVFDEGPCDLALLGGGTLINQSPWLIDEFERALGRAGQGAVFGSGVGDLFFWGDHFERWVPLLARCRHVGVRGPDSLALLRERGCPHARMIGDPYLYLQAPLPARPVARRLGVNLGSTNDAHWGGKDAGLLERVGEALIALKARGWSFAWISVWSKDLPLLEAVRARVDPESPPVLDARAQPLECYAALAGCELFLGEKLHACAMAAVAGVPMVALEYQPKVRDFTASLGMECWTLRSDFKDGARLVELVERLQGEAGAARERMLAAKAARARELAEFAGEIRQG